MAFYIGASHTHLIGPPSQYQALNHRPRCWCVFICSSSGIAFDKQRTEYQSGKLIPVGHQYLTGITSPQNIMTTILHKQSASTKDERSVHYCHTTMSWNNSMIGSKQADKQHQPTLEPAWLGKLIVCRRRDQAQAFQ